MSQQEPHHQHHHHHHDTLPAKLAAGGLSCMAVSFILNPMDVIKCRMQIQVKAPNMTELPYRNFPQSFAKIFSEEGVRGLFKGITASMLREASYSSLRLGLYDPVKHIVANSQHKGDITLSQKILAGAITGAIGSAVANPTDLIKIRFQNVLPGQPAPYKNTFHAFAVIAKTEGLLSGLYRGVVPTVVRASILTASQLATYDHSKHLMLKSGYFQDVPSTHMLASIIAGLVTTTTTNPVDVIKTRVMSDASGLKYKGPIDCALQIVKNEGLSAFMKGWTASFARLGPHFVMSLPLLELIRNLMGLESV